MEHIFQGKHLYFVIEILLIYLYCLVHNKLFVMHYIQLILLLRQRFCIL
uniref:Uncharacterized protein n=1 Tax=CrAss-like virus sp. ctYsL76 TaxID=2826826 RepID=A0A8S5QMD5_9CAUD|nr:MAG TPA: hypothetical protein [CrAss-like virus sp. ctYsL76]